MSVPWSHHLNSRNSSFGPMSVAVLNVRLSLSDVQTGPSRNHPTQPFALDPNNDGSGETGPPALTTIIGAKHPTPATLAYQSKSPVGHRIQIRWPVGAAPNHRSGLQKIALGKPLVANYNKLDSPRRPCQNTPAEEFAAASRPKRRRRSNRPGNSQAQETANGLNL